MRKFEILLAAPSGLRSRYGCWSSLVGQMVTYKSWVHLDDRVLKIFVQRRSCDELRCSCLFCHATGGGVFEFLFMREGTLLKKVVVTVETHPRFTPCKLTVEEKDKLVSECLKSLPNNDRVSVQHGLDWVLSSFPKTSVRDVLELHDDTELELPELDNVAWHVSAGQDWRPLIFFSSKQMNRWDTGQKLSRPSLHINTCLDEEGELKLLNLLESDDAVFDDGLSQIFFETYSYVSLKDPRLVSHTKGFCDFGRGLVFDELGADGFLVNVKLVDLRSGYEEYTQLLYLFSENVQTFRRFVSDGDVSVKHLIATCEGLAFGGCRYSILKYLKGEGVVDDLYKKSALPETVTIPATGQATTYFKEMMHADRVSFAGKVPYLSGSCEVNIISPKYITSVR